MAAAQMVEDFTPEGYRELLNCLSGRGFTAVSFALCQPDAAHIILRHDIDISIVAAVNMAEIEADAGLMAHYYVLLRSELYNPYANAELAGLRKILDLGHDVGLHFDASLYPDGDDELDTAAAGECAMLEQMLGRAVTSITFHRPVKSLLGRTAALAGRIHGYQPRFFSDIGYCSDSRGGWFHGHPLDHNAVEAGTALQLLTHPIWWTGAGTPIEKLERFMRGHDRATRRHLAENSEPYRTALSAAAKTTQETNA